MLQVTSGARISVAHRLEVVIGVGREEALHECDVGIGCHAAPLAAREVPVEPADRVRGGLADVRVLVVELDVVVCLDPDELLGTERRLVGLCAYSGNSEVSVVPCTISSGVGATSGAWTTALYMK
jgi:hypothetical protein